jgi:hypothetical protein
MRNGLVGAVAVVALTVTDAADCELNCGGVLPVRLTLRRAFYHQR